MNLTQAIALVEDLSRETFAFVDLGAREGPEHDLVTFKVRVNRVDVLKALHAAHEAGVEDFDGVIMYSETQVILTS